MVEFFQVKTELQTEFRDITSKIEDIIAVSGVSDGLCVVFVPHTTAGVTINESADPDVVRDIIKELGKIIPMEDNYAHLEGNSAAHIKASLTGASETLIVRDGRPLLGTWQGVFFCEYDGPRKRSVYVTVI